MGVRQASHRRDAITALTLGVALALGPAGSATAAAPALPGTSVATSVSGGPGTLGAVADLATPRLLPDAAADAGGRGGLETLVDANRAGEVAGGASGGRL